MGKLKSSLLSHQAQSAKKAAAKQRDVNRATMAKGSQHSVSEKRNIKRQRQEREKAQRAKEELEALKKAANAKAEAEHLESKGKGKAEAVEVEGLASDGRKALTAEDLARYEAQRLAKAIVPIAPDDTVLLLGEANFSFARALVEGRCHAGHLVCATAYDSEAETYEKYPDAAANVEALRKKGARVAFSIDAGALEKSKKAVGTGKRWSRVVFNFPHAGKGITDQDRNVRENQVLLLRTMKSVAPLLTDGPTAFPIVETAKGRGNVKPRGKANGKALRVRSRAASVSEDEEMEGVTDDEYVFEEDVVDEAAEDNTDSAFKPTKYTRPKFTGAVPMNFTPPNRQGTLLVTLLAQNPYTLWEMPRLATRPPSTAQGGHGKQPRYRQLRSFEFVPAAYPGYAHRRTIGWREGLSKAQNEEIVGRKGLARTWEFCVWDGPKEEGEEEERKQDRGWGQMRDHADFGGWSGKY